MERTSQDEKGEKKQGWKREEERESERKGEEKKEEAKEVETPKSNVRNTTRAEARVKRYSRNVGERSERTGRRAGKIFGTLNSRVQEAKISASGEITEESYAHFARAARSRQQFRIGLEIALSPPPSLPSLPLPHPLVLSSALRALECSISDTRTTLNPAQWRGCNAI